MIFLLDRFQVADAVYCYWQQRESWDIFSAAHTMQEAQFEGNVDLSILEASLKVTKKLRKMQYQKAKDGDFGQLFCDLRCRGTNNEY